MGVKIETLRSDVLFWENKLRRDKSDYAQRRWVKAKERLKLEEIKQHNVEIK